ncbi:MAG TPA: SDR family oxidoreductase [Streptosporangiaceae bacterium]|nr:SDR family oxidoreductase [Streptosporangiaceae bacterium]
MDLDLAGKRVLIIGGSRGIGRAVAMLLAEEGCCVTIGARDPARIETTVSQLTTRGYQARGGSVDAADHDALRSFVANAAADLGGLDVLVYAPSGALGHGNDPESWRQGIAVDLLGAVTACEAGIPFLRDSGAGAIVVIGTVSTIEAVGPRRAYNSVKAALLPYVKFLARELAPAVRANVVSPGMVYFEGGVWDAVRQLDPGRFAGALARNPMGRMATPEEVANAVAFLASPRAGFISGTHLLCDGARTEGVQF